MPAQNSDVTLTIRGIDASVKAKLKQRAARHGRSMEGEVRHILADAVRPVNVGVEFHQLGAVFGGLDDLAEVMEDAVTDRRGSAP